MPPVLLDTNAVSDLMLDHLKVKARTSACPDPVVTCTTVRGEIRFGIERLPPGKKRADLESRALITFAGLPCQSITEQVADAYGTIKAFLEGKGLNLSDNDLWIAATALTLRAVLVTRDQVFKHVLGLQVEDWTV